MGGVALYASKGWRIALSVEAGAWNMRTVGAEQPELKFLKKVGDIGWVCWK
jgi:hypothetical protein